MRNDADLLAKQTMQRMTVLTASSRAVANSPRTSSTLVTVGGQVQRPWLVGDPFDSPRYYFEEHSIA